MTETLDFDKKANDISSFDILEEKINQTIQLINKLRAENDELKKYNLELINRVQEKERSIAQLNEDFQKLKEQKGNSEIYKHKEQKIQKKVEEIIAKLEKLHNLDDRF